MLPPSESEEVDEAIHGVAFWILDEEIARSDTLSIYVRGLSDGVQSPAAEEGGAGGEPKAKYKTLRIDFASPGDEFDVREREFRLMTPGYEWIYD